MNSQVVNLVNYNCIHQSSHHRPVVVYEASSYLWWAIVICCCCCCCWAQSTLYDCIWLKSLSTRGALGADGLEDQPQLLRLPKISRTSKGTCLPQLLAPAAWLLGRNGAVSEATRPSGEFTGNLRRLEAVNWDMVTKSCSDWAVGLLVKFGEFTGCDNQHVVRMVAPLVVSMIGEVFAKVSLPWSQMVVAGVCNLWTLGNWLPGVAFPRCHLQFLVLFAVLGNIQATPMAESRKFVGTLFMATPK